MSHIKQLFDEYKQRDEDALLELIKYREAYDVLMDYFDDFNSETKTTIHLKLKKLGL